MAKFGNTENATGLILGGLVMIVIFGFLTWLQIERINKDSYWVIFRLWFIPIPAILLSGIGAVGGIVLFFQGIFASLSNVFHK